MQAISLRLKNFGSYADTFIEFKDMDLIGIIGRDRNNTTKSNGMGKSQLLEAIEFALYNKCRTDSPDSLVRVGSDGNMNVEFEFKSSAGQVVEIDRGWKKGKKSKGSLSVKVDGEPKASGSKTGDPIIEQIVGIEHDIFTATSFFKQEKADAFTSTTSSKRKEYIRKIDELGIFDRARKRASEKASIAETEGNTIKVKMQTIESRIPDIDQLANDIQIKEGEKISVGQKLIEAEKLQAERDLQQERIKRHLEVVKKVDECISKKKYYNTVIEGNDNTLKSVQLELNQYKNNIADFKLATIMDDDKYNEMVEDLKEINREKMQLETEFDTYCRIHAPEIKSLLEEKKYVLNTAICPTCGGNIPKGKKQDEINRIDGKIHDLEGLKPSEDKIRELADKIGALQVWVDTENGVREKNREAQSQHNVIIEKVSSLTTRINDLQEERKRINLEVEDLDKEVKSYQDEVNKVPTIEENLIEDQAFIIRDYKDKMSDIDSNIGGIRKMIDQAVKDMKELEDLKVELKKFNKQRMIYVELERAFGKDGIPNLIIENTLVEIEGLANEILAEIIPEMRVYFETVKDTKKGEALETLDIMIENNGEVREYNTFSGGERTIINFSIRFAISQYLSQKSGKRVEMVMLDEVFGALDENNRNKVVAILQSLRKKFKQIFVVSHTAIRDLFSNIITVEKNNGVSKVI